MIPHATFGSAGYQANSSRSSLGTLHEDLNRDLPTSSKDGGLIEPVAIVGFSFKLPQDAISTDSFWELMMEKRSTATDFPKDRLSASAIYHPDPNRRGTVSIFPV